jgi:2-polyprenyl-3-methyl-5-hydroxy-6-metoxy-1,4-benzoquinol methylase
VRWPLRRARRRGRLPSLGQDYAEGHRRYVERLGADAEYWLRTKPFSVPHSHELGECLRTFAHIVEHLGLDVRAQVIDVGCGPGWLSEFLARCGYWVTGIDVSEDMIRVARKRLARIDRSIGAGLEPIAEFHAFPASELKWTGRFDAAILYDAMHHLDDEVETLRAIRRSLVPGGHMFIHEGVRPERGSEGERRLIAEMEEFGTLESPFDPEYLVAVIQEAGFTDVRRFAAVDELLDVSARDQALQRVERQLTKPTTNTILASNPVPAELTPDGGGFAAALEIQGPWTAAPDGELSLPVSVTNAGRRFWPAGDGSHHHGVITLGPYVSADDGERIELPRHALPRSISPGESVGVEIRLPRASVEGRDAVAIDLVREGLAWFADYGSIPVVVPLTEDD